MKKKTYFYIVMALTLLWLILPQAAQAATYYVDVNVGDDTWPGTRTQPFKTIQKVASTMDAGDTVIVLSGNYPGAVNITKSGNAAESIVYQANGKVVLNGSFDINADYIHVIGFELIGGGIFVKGDYCQVLDNYVHDRTGNVGIGAYGNYGIVRNNKIIRAVECGIKVNGQNNLIENNDISHTLTRPPDGSYTTDADGIRFFGTGHIFRGNYIHHIMHSETGGDPHIDGFQTWGPASDIIFEQNFYESTDTSGSNQTVMISDYSGSVRNLRFSNNTFAMSDIGYCPMSIYGGMSGGLEEITIVNNTFRHNNGAANGAIWLRGVKNATIRNNTFYDYCNDEWNYVYFYTDLPSENVDIGSNRVYNSNGIYPNEGPYPGDIWGNLPATDPPPSILYGDVSGDGEISAFDAALAAHIAVDLEHPDIKNPSAAEVSGDGEVTAYDAALIAQRAVGLIEKFPVEGG